MKLKNQPQHSRFHTLLPFLLLVFISCAFFTLSALQQEHPRAEAEKLVNILNMQVPPILFRDNEGVSEFFADSDIDPLTSHVIRRECAGRVYEIFSCRGEKSGFYIYLQSEDGTIHRFGEWEFHFLLHPSHNVVPYLVELGNHSAYLDLYERPNLSIEPAISHVAMGSIDGETQHSIYVYGLHFDSAGEGTWFLIEFYHPSINQRGMAWIYHPTTEPGYLGAYYTAMPGLPVAYYLEHDLEQVDEEGQYIGTIPAGTVLLIDAWLACGDLSGYAVSYIAENRWIDTFLLFSTINIPQQDIPYIFYAPCGA